MLFRLGQVVATPGALNVLHRSGQTPADFLTRHVSGDFGRVDGHDEKANRQAIQEGGRILSSYTTVRGEEIWVITEADRSSTTLLLPSEY